MTNIINRQAILETVNLDVGYPKQLIKSGLNLSAFEGEQIAVIGANGSGKSTLLRTLAGLQESRGGLVHLFQKEISNYSVKERARLISFVAAGRISDRYMTVEELVRLGRFPHGGVLARAGRKDADIITQAMETVGLGDMRKAKISEISDGERQKALIAGALAQDTPVILLDEPVSFLDPENRLTVLNLIRQLSARHNKTVIFSSHDIGSAVRRADKMWVFHKENVLEAAPEDFLHKGIFDDLFSLPNVHFDKELLDYRETEPIKHELLVYAEEDDELFLTSFNRLCNRLSIRPKAVGDSDNVTVLLRPNRQIFFLQRGVSQAVPDFLTLAALLKEKFGTA